MVNEITFLGFRRAIAPMSPWILPFFLLTDICVIVQYTRQFCGHACRCTSLLPYNRTSFNATNISKRETPSRMVAPKPLYQDSRLRVIPKKRLIQLR